MRRIFCDKCGNDITDDYAKVDIEVGPFLRAVEKKAIVRTMPVEFCGALE